VTQHDPVYGGWSPAPPPVAVPLGADPHPRLLSTPRARWWRPVLGVLLAAAVVTIASVVVVLVATLLVGSGPVDQRTEDALDPGTWQGLLANNLVILTIVPAAVLAVLVVHRERVGWLASVTGRPRWGLLWRFFLVALAVVVVSFALSYLLPTDTSLDGTTPSTTALVATLVVILLTTPLQSMAEEVGFRGYLTQAVASWARRPQAGIAAGVVVSATLFALAHGGQDPWLFADRFSFGLVASWLAWRTGGLEAPVALHAANNLVSLGAGAFAGTLSDSLSLSSLEWQFAVLDVLSMLAFAVVADRLARRWAPQRLRVLSPAPPVGYPERRPSTPSPTGDDASPWGMG
jgi:membrane protease YdiL (CAAX protease family)